MNDGLNVWMDGHPAGTLSITGSGALRFHYDAGWLQSADSTPLSLSIPVNANIYGPKQMEPFLRGLLPENPNVLEALARTYHVSPRSTFGLLKHVGEDVAGALQILPPDQSSTDATTAATSQSTPITEPDLVTMLHETIEAYRAPAIQRHPLRISVAGQQPKVALIRSGNDWAVPAPGTPSTHILKPAFPETGTFPDSDIAELLTLQAAQACGLATAQTELWQSQDGSIRAIVSTRFDRTQRDGVWHRLHQEDLCQLMSLPPERKYQYERGSSLKQIGRFLRTHLRREDREAVLQALYRQVVFKTLALDADAHAKNYSLMLSGRSVALAPVYDTASMAAFAESHDDLISPFKIGDEYRLEHITHRDLLTAGTDLGLAEATAATTVAEMVQLIPDAFEHAAATLPAAPIIARTLEQLSQRSPFL